MEAKFAAPQEDVTPKSSQWKGRHFFYGICGSIGAVDSVRQIRELRRHGAAVTPVMTAEAMKFITPLSVSWAAQTDVIETLSASSEHLRAADAVILCPASWNTVVEISQGLCTKPLTTLVAIQLARRVPVFIVPTFHREFEAHPLYAEVLKRLESWPNVRVWFGPLEEGRAKMPEPETLVEAFGSFWGECR